VIQLHQLDRFGLEIAQGIMIKHHYLHSRVDRRSSLEGYAVMVNGMWGMGYLILGRPKATRCRDWYGSVGGVRDGKCEVTCWQVLNLARVYITPHIQKGGILYGPDNVPGFTDRKGAFRSILASEILKKLIQQVGYDYLLLRPPCFLDEPYEIKWLLSYCDTRLHKGTIYQAAGFERYRINDDGIETWRTKLPTLTFEQDQMVRAEALRNPRSIAYRAKRAQLELF